MHELDDARRRVWARNMYYFTSIIFAVGCKSVKNAKIMCRENLALYGITSCYLHDYNTSMCSLMHAYIAGHKDGWHGAEERDPAAEEDGDEGGHQRQTQTIVTSPPVCPGHHHHLWLLLHHHMSLVGSL